MNHITVPVKHLILVYIYISIFVNVSKRKVFRVECS